MIILFVIFYSLESSRIEILENVPLKKNALNYAIGLSLKAFIKMDFDNGMRSYTFKIILFSTLVCGFVIFSHYETVFASILIVESENLPYKSWNEVAESDKIILAWKGSTLYDWFKDAPEESPMKKIFDQGRVQPLNEMGFDGSIPLLMSGTHFGFNDVDLYKEFREFPCKISPLKANELM